MDIETLNAVKAEMGKISAPIIERIEKSEERAKRMDETIARLGASNEHATAYFAAMQRGTPFAARSDETPEQAADRFVSEHDFGVTIREAREGRASRGRRRPPARALDFVRIIRAMSVARLRSGTPTHEGVLEVLSSWGDKRRSGLVEQARDLEKKERSPGAAGAPHVRAQNSVILGAGAGFVTTDVMAGFVDYLWPKTIVRALGAQSIPTTKGALEILYLDTSASATRRGQTSPTTQTSVGEKRLQLVLTSLSAHIAMTNELLDEADILLDALYLSQLTRAVATQENLEFITGVGLSQQPRGIDWWVDDAYNPMVSSAHDFNRTVGGSSVATFRTARTDLLTAQQVVAEENIDLGMGSPGYAMSLATQYGLMRCLNTNDLPIFGDEMRGGTLLGAAYGATSQIPKTEAGDGAGTGTGNKGKVYFGDFSTFVVAEDPRVTLKVVDGAAYRDESGNVVAGLTNNETVAVIHAKNTTGCLMRGKEFARIKSVDWAAAF